MNGYPFILKRAGVLFTSLYLHQADEFAMPGKRSMAAE
jgi:hypothetical protein